MGLPTVGIAAPGDSGLLLLLVLCNFISPVIFFLFFLSFLSDKNYPVIIQYPLLSGISIFVCIIILAYEQTLTKMAVEVEVRTFKVYAKANCLPELEIKSEDYIFCCD